MIELPFLYRIEGLPHDYLIFRTEKVDDSRDILVTLVPNLPQQHPLDVVSMLLSDPRISMAERRHSALAVLRGVEASVSILDTEDDDRVKVTTSVREQPPAKDRWDNLGGTFYARTDIPKEEKQEL